VGRENPLWGGTEGVAFGVGLFWFAFNPNPAALPRREYRFSSLVEPSSGMSGSPPVLQENDHSHLNL